MTNPPVSISRRPSAPPDRPSAMPLRAASEELANALTHGCGLLLSIIGLCLLVEQAWTHGGAARVTAAVVFGGALVALYAASTLSHSVRHRGWKEFFWIADQACVFLLIAASYTPFALVYLNHGWWWVLTALMWGCAAAGTLFTLLLADRSKPVSARPFLLYGWLPVLAAKPLLEALPGPALAWAAAGGLSYTVGAVFLTYDHRGRFHHAIWHLFVLSGSACHFIAVREYVLIAA